MVADAALVEKFRQQLLELAYTNVERTRFLLKHAPDDFDWQAIPADSGARYDFRRDARRTRPRSMPRARPPRYGRCDRAALEKPLRRQAP
jgi:hypothetical protein